MLHVTLSRGEGASHHVGRVYVGLCTCFTQRQLTGYSLRQLGQNILACKGEVPQKTRGGKSGPVACCTLLSRCRACRRLTSSWLLTTPDVLL